MKDSSLDKFIVGGFFTVAGLLIIIFHKSIKDWRDWWASRDWPVGYGDTWTGKYTRGGLIATYVIIILIGVGFFAIGVATVVSAFTH